MEHTPLVKRKSMSSQLRLLICSANIGNAEPTPESLAALIPNDGDVNSVGNNTEKNRDKQVRQGKFDIIVIGMQEATFFAPRDSSFSKKDSFGSSSESMRTRSTEDISSNESHTNPSCSTSSFSLPSMSLKVANQRNSEMTYPMDTPYTEFEGNTSHLSLPTSRHLSRNKPSVTKLTSLPTKKLSSAYQSTRFAVRSVIASEDHTQRPKTIFKTPSDSTVDKTKKKNHAEDYGTDTRILHNLIAHRCPSYEFVVECLRGEMRLIILVKKNLVHETEDVEYKAVNTGIGSMLANKGGIIAAFNICKTRLSFVSAHLEAHEGKNHYINRCVNLATILSGSKVGKSRYDASISSHHCFVSGDLNYRVDLPHDLTHEEHVNEAYAMIEKKDWKHLNASDELFKALRRGDCLAGFRSPICKFPPTFKVTRQRSGFVYNPTRTPSYTDRILWKSASGLEDNLKIFAYEPCPDFITSDHKPIRGAFTLNTNSPKQKERRQSLTSTKINSSMRNLRHLSGWGKSTHEDKSTHIFISNLQCMSIDDELFNGHIDPYVMFVTDPKDVMMKCTSAESSPRFFNTNQPSSIIKIRNGWPCTKIKKGDPAPSWGEGEVHLSLRGSLEEMISTGAMLYLTLMNFEKHSKDYLIGTVALSVKYLFSKMQSQSRRASQSSALSRRNSLRDVMQTITVQKSLLKNGQVRGQLKCDIVVWRMKHDFSHIGSMHDRSRCKMERRVGLAIAA